MWTDQPASFPEVTKRDQSSTWRSAKSTHSFVGFCSCCLMLIACTRQVSTAEMAHLTFYPRVWQPAHLPFLSRHSPPTGESNYWKWLYAQQKCADEKISVNAHRHVQGYVHIHTLLCIHVCICRRVRKRGQRRRICKRMPRRPRKRLQAYTQRSQPTQTIPCVKW